MSLRTGARIGAYEIVAPLGAGGMGEVFRARDTKLGRDVALKILPAAFATDPDRLMRFAREAKTLAALNHPHIAQVYGLEDSPADSTPGASRALVMELVEGEDLSARIGRGPLPLDEALHIARQIADGLDAAHELGVIHRDLKPSNIKVRDDGTVKILDFGLAKALDADPAGSKDSASSATLTSPMLTLRGVILGTAAYMAPEQAKGKPVDRRADIWAFGCVLYEMLTGQRAFKGEDATDTIAALVTKDPDWTLLPPSTPDSVRRLLRRCLSKPVKDRLRSIGDAALDIAEAEHPARDVSTTGAAEPRATPGTRGGLWPRAAVVGIAFVAVAAGGWLLGRRQVSGVPSQQRVVRLSIAPSTADAITVSGNDRDLAISPDGNTIAYVAGNGTGLIVRSLDRNETVRIQGAGLPHNPFFSSDGAWVGFSDGLSAIKKVSARGGAVETVCRIMQPGVAASWYGDSIVFAQSGQIVRVSAAGGTPEAITPLPGADQPALNYPTFLPDGKAVLAGFTRRSGSSLEGGIALVDLQTRTQKVVVSLGSAPGLINGLMARFVAPNHLMYRAAIEPGARSKSALRVIQFDLGRREPVGAPAIVDEPVYVTDFGGYADFDIAGNGTLVYVPVEANPAVRRLVWVQRDGREESIDLPARAYTYPNFSSDGRQVAIDIRDQENDTWIWDVARNTLRRLTFDPGFDQYAIWTHDNQRVAHIIGSRILWQRADGSGQPEQLAVRTHLLAPYAFSAGDRELVFREDFPETGHDLMMLSLDAKRTVVPLLQTRFNELNAEISPDGRWLAYESDESGPPGIYVRPFPDVNAGKWQVSTAGGRTPRWSRDGHELFFLGLDGAMMTAQVETAQAFVSHAPTQLFAHRNYVGGASSIGRTYDVAPDGRRFLMIKPAPPANIAVILNWAQTLGHGSQ